MCQGCFLTSFFILMVANDFKAVMNAYMLYRSHHVILNKPPASNSRWPPKSAGYIEVAVKNK